MKALILLGGLGTRLRPITNHINKHRIVVAGKSMAEHALESVLYAGIRDIVIRTYDQYFKSVGKKYQKRANCNIEFSIGDIKDTKGIAYDIKQAGNLLKGGPFAVVFGDVFFQNPEELRKYLHHYNKNDFDGMLLLAKAKRPEKHATPFFEKDKVVKVVEKCVDYVHNLVVTTWDIFPREALNYLDELKPSERGELEISDLRNIVIERHKVGYYKIKGWWTDAGTPEDLLLTNRLVLKRDFPKTEGFIDKRAKIINSKIQASTIFGNVTLKNCSVRNSIIMGGMEQEGKKIQDTIMYNKTKLKST